MFLLIYGYVFFFFYTVANEMNKRGKLNASAGSTHVYVHARVSIVCVGVAGMRQVACAAVVPNEKSLLKTQYGDF